MEGRGCACRRDRIGGGRERELGDEEGKGKEPQRERERERERGRKGERDQIGKINCKLTSDTLQQWHVL